MKKYFLSFFAYHRFCILCDPENQSLIFMSGSESAPEGGNSHILQYRRVDVPYAAATAATPAPTDANTATGTGYPPPPGLYRDGSYDGDSVNAYFGNVQVEAVIAGGKLTDVKILDYPQDRGTRCASITPHSRSWSRKRSFPKAPRLTSSPAQHRQARDSSSRSHPHSRKQSRRI